MNIVQINDRLRELFDEHKVVFWNDPEGEFEGTLEQLDLGKINIIRPDKIGQFNTKVLIESESSGEDSATNRKILVYSSSAEPKPADDWLLDIRLYSYQFSADWASILIDELGLVNHSLRDHLVKRKGFFASKERTERFKQFISPEEIEKELDKKMIAVLVKSEHSDFFDIIRTLYGAIADLSNLDDVPKVWQQIGKMELEDAFWGFTEETFGYAEEHRTLRNLLTALFVTDLAHSVNEEIPENLRHFVLPKNRHSNVTVCLGQWRDSSSKAKNYDVLSNLVAEVLNIKVGLTQLSKSNLIGSVTFFETEKVVAAYLKDTVIETAETIDAENIKEIAQKRQDMHWANLHMPTNSEIPRTAFNSVYNAIIAASDFFASRNKYRDSLSFSESKDVYNNYTGGLYKFDQLYRIFCENADTADTSGWEILKPLRDKIEDVYSNWFLDSLALKWESCISPQSWTIEDVTNQYNFFDKHVRKVAGVKSSRGSRTAYVIISDALRYEAAEELTGVLNGKYRFTAKLESMLGVVPSYTALGMAALLPHDELGYTEKGDVLINQKKCASSQQRKDVLGSVKGSLIKADELLGMKRDECRDFVRDNEIVYIYHDEIDAVGDDASTEEDTFEAVRRAIDKLSKLVSFVINTLSAKYVFVTTDHGFVFTQRKPDETDKYKISVNKEDIAKANKRFLLGNNIPVVADTVTGKVSDTAGVSPGSDISFVVPKGMSRFNFTGGSRFFHGGMSLQEVVIPVITVEQMRDKNVEKTRERKVSIQVLGTNHLITTNQYRFELLQADAVSDRVKPLTIKVALYDGDIPVTDIQTVTFDSRSDDMSERKKEISVTLQNKDYDRNKCYRFILRDVETNIEVGSVEVKIDRLFTSDF